MGKVYEYRYGFKSTKVYSDLELELYMFLHPEEGDLGKAGHFKRIVEILWPEGSKTHFFWHPWAERMLELSCQHKFLAVIGCASSGKTDFFAIWGIVNWLAAPKETLVMATSTSLKDSRKRIWGSFTNYFTKASIKLPGKLVDSMGIIRTDDGTGKFNDKQGIALIAGEKKKEREAVGKLIGMKNTRVILIADELPELSEAILEAALGNLSANPYHQLIGIGNFNSVYDPLGRFAQPKDDPGYETVTPEDTEWETEYGYCVRFDGLKSPNILGGEDVWPKIYDSKMLEQHKKALGETTATFWRMVRSFPCPVGSENLIFTEADLLQYKAFKKPIWLEPPIKVAGFDPSFTAGGDRAIVMLGFYGIDDAGKHIICFDRYVILREDVTLKTKSRSYQIAEKFKETCIAEGVPPQYAAMDASGAGAVLMDVVAEVWSNKVLPVQFGGAASDYAVSVNDNRTAKEHYVNRVSELWYCGLDFLKSGQLKGIHSDLARELKARQFDTVKGANLRIRVETKTDMKARVGFSPDIADSAMVMLDLCRVRLGAMAGEGSSSRSREDLEWKDQVDNAQAVYENVDYSEQGVEEVYGVSNY